MDQIKVGYKSLNGYNSKAYVSEHPPHIGTDKYTDEPLEVVPTDYGWVEVESSVTYPA